MNTNTKNSIAAIQFIQELSSLAARLAERDLVVRSLRCDWGTFGSWTMQVSRGKDQDAYTTAVLARQWSPRGPNVLSICWDGKERELSIRQGHTPLLSGPTNWQSKLGQRLDDRHAAIRLAEEYAIGWTSDSDSKTD